MNRRWVTACATLLLAAPAQWILAAETASQAAAASLMPDHAPESLAELDQVLENLRRLIWSLPSSMGVMAEDEQGRSLAADLSELVLTDPAQAQIAAARVDAEAMLARDPQARDAALLPVVQLLAKESARMGLLVGFWSMKTQTRVHMDYIAPLLAKAQPADRDQAQARLDALAARLDGVRKAAAGADPVAILRSYTETDPLAGYPEDLNQVRVDLAARQPKLSDAQLAATALRLRDSPCPPAVVPTAQNARPRIVRAPDVDDYYPGDLRQQYIQGLVRVELHLSETGCVTGARVETSSGVPPLDMAAVNVVLQMEMSPAVENGKAAATVAVMPVRFRLPDTARKPPAQAPAR